MGYIEAICISAKKGIVKDEIAQAKVIENWGIQNDAHAGKWHRQVSLLAGESIDRMREKIPTLKNGAFAENIITRDIDLSTITVGENLSLGKNVVLSITQIGKKCHKACAIKEATGDCIMPKEGLFAEVVAGGSIKPGDVVAKNSF
jgi:MOSC domain-containing protein YiiM